MNKKCLIIPILLIFGKVNSQTAIKETLFESLSLNDTLKIQYHSVGEYDFMCGVSKKGYIKFFYNKKQLVAQTLKDGKLVYADVDNAKREFLIELEKDSHSIDGQENVCTHSNGYIFYLNNESKFRIIDQTCKWFGFPTMIYKLFGFEFK